jgi:transposase
LTIADQTSKIADQKSKIYDLNFQIAQLQRLLYGSKRERFVSNETFGQLSLPFDFPEQEKKEVETENISYKRKKVEHKNHPGRIALPDHLPVEEITIEPKEDTTGMKCIGKEVTDELELIPAKLFIKRYNRPKYEDTVNGKIIIADLPSRPIERGIAGSGLLSQIMVDKFVDHLPIYRQVQRFSREKINIPANTIDGWQSKISTLLEPLYDVLKKLVLKQGYLQVDETPIRVLDRNLKERCHHGYYWVYYSPIQKAVIYDYRPGRGREGPKEMLINFKGYLQSDGYSVYDWFGEKENIELLNCWAHTRRNFEKAIDYDKSNASFAMTEIQKLYDIERKARINKLTPQQRHELRLEEALPVLNNFGKWLADKLKTELPKTPIGKAVQYAVSRWDNLMTYLYDGFLEIDNNFVENAIRPNALGRKNYLFAGSHKGAERAAMFYSFFGTCAKNNINPYEWLKKVLEIIPDYHVNKLQDLLPQNLNLQK